MHRFLASTFFLLLSGSALAADPALERQVMDLLNAYEAGPTAQELQAMGPGVDEILRAVVLDEKRVVTERARALFSLGAFPTDDNHTLLLDTARDATAASILRRKAVYALATGWSATASDELAPLFTTDDTQLRIALANALAKVPTARTVLQDRLAVESNEAVRKALQGALE